VRAQGFERPLRPWLTLFVEAFSRVVPGWALSARPHSGSILAAFGAAATVTDTKPWGGVPVRLRVDRGADFLCDALREACGRLGVVLDPAPAYSPFRKGKVEAAGKSVDRALLPPLPGYRGAGRETREARPTLLSFDELVDVLRAGIEAWNRSHVHPVLGCTLTEAWERDATPVRVVTEDRLRWMMLAEDHRKVQKEGVRFGGRYFTAPELTGRRGTMVAVLHWPHLALRVQVGEVVVGDELLAVLRQPLVKRAPRHQRPTHVPSLEQRPLRFNPTKHDQPPGKRRTTDPQILPHRARDREHPYRLSACTPSVALVSDDIFARGWTEGELGSP
jgi:hypothetical protein